MILNIVISLDYEVFFGSSTGDVNSTLIEPTEALCKIARRHSVPLVFFVDIGFLLRLKEEGGRNLLLMRDYDKVVSQLEGLVRAGHELQLHIHSHWEDSHWCGNGWKIDRARYRLHEFSLERITEIVNRYSFALRDISGGCGVCAFRAGGWLIQPFGQIRSALLGAGIRIDSTVFQGGASRSRNFGFDFTNAPIDGRWFFDVDPLVVNADGKFLEVPIASYAVPPLFYWRMAYLKKFGDESHMKYGEGAAMSPSKEDIVNKLFFKSVSVVSIDGYKSSLIDKAFKQYSTGRKSDFVIIGHPKSLTPYSLSNLESFIVKSRNNNFCGYSEYLGLFN